MNGPILVPVDFSPSSEAALRWAFELAEATGTEVEVLHVVHQPNPVYAIAQAGVLGTLEEAGREATDAFVDRVSADHPAAGSVPRTVVTGTVPSRIIEFVERRGFGHVVMGARGQGGIGERLLGSKAERVALLCSVPVTIVKA